MTTKTKPSTKSAAAVARTISRLLRQSGFQMCEKKTRCHWTDGFEVHRVGYSSEVSVRWHSNIHPAGPRWKEEAARIREETTRAYQLLRDRGYEFDEYNYIRCEKPE